MADGVEHHSKTQSMAVTMEWLRCWGARVEHCRNHSVPCRCSTRFVETLAFMTDGTHCYHMFMQLCVAASKGDVQSLRLLIDCAGLQASRWFCFLCWQLTFAGHTQPDLGDKDTRCPMHLAAAEVSVAWAVQRRTFGHFVDWVLSRPGSWRLHIFSAYLPIQISKVEAKVLFQ